MKLLRTIAPLLAAILFTATAFAGKPGVIIIKNDGSQTEISFDRLARIDIGKDGITTRTVDGVSEDAAYGTFSKILIGAGTTAISDLLGNGSIAVYPTVTTGKVTVAGIEKGASAEAYNTAGTLAAKAVARTDGTATLDLSGATPGVYIIATAGKTAKIIKQ